MVESRGLLAIKPEVDVKRSPKSSKRTPDTSVDTGSVFESVLSTIMPESAHSNTVGQKKNQAEKLLRVEDSTEKNGTHLTKSDSEKTVHHSQPPNSAVRHLASETSQELKRDGSSKVDVNSTFKPEAFQDNKSQLNSLSKSAKTPSVSALNMKDSMDVQNDNHSSIQNTKSGISASLSRTIEQELVKKTVNPVISSPFDVPTPVLKIDPAQERFGQLSEEPVLGVSKTNTSIDVTNDDVKSETKHSLLQSSQNHMLSAENDASSSRLAHEQTTSVSNNNVVLSTLPQTIVTNGHQQETSEKSSINLSSPNASDVFKNLVLGQVQSSQNSLSVQVHPDGMGTVTITVNQNENHLVVQVEASNEQTMQWFQKEKDALTGVLQSSGLQISNLQISYDQGSSQQQNSHGFMNRQNKQSTPVPETFTVDPSFTETDTNTNQNIRRWFG